MGTLHEDQFTFMIICPNSS